MKRIAIVLACLALPAWAGPELHFKDENVSVRLQNSPCVAPVADLLKDEKVPLFRAGESDWQGRTLKLCWGIFEPGVVSILDEEGDTGYLPLNAFKPAPGI